MDTVMPSELGPRATNASCWQARKLTEATREAARDEDPISNEALYQRLVAPRKPASVVEPRRSKPASVVEFNLSMNRICNVLNCIDKGSIDHLFVDAETKATCKAQWEAKMKAAILRFVRANPDVFCETEDGKIAAFPERLSETEKLRALFGVPITACRPAQSSPPPVKPCCVPGEQ